MGKTLLIVLIIVLLLCLIIVSFTSALIKDLIELKSQPLPEKFEWLIQGVNDGLFQGKAEVVTFPKDVRTVNLFCEDHANMIVTFFYSTGKMSVILRYKYLHEEMRFEQTIPDMRNASSLRQKDCANIFVEDALKKMEEHQKKVAGFESQTEVVKDTYDESDPLSMAASTFNSLSKNQKKSYINLLYVIAKADDCSDDTASQEIVILEELRTLNLNWDECHDYYLKTGESQIIKDLSCNNIDSNAMDMMIFGSFCISKESEIKTNKMFECFGKIGISEEDLTKKIEKTLLLCETFL